MSKRTVFSLEDMANIIGNINRGRSQADMDWKYTLCNIIRNKDKIRISWTQRGFGSYYDCYKTLTVYKLCGLNVEKAQIFVKDRTKFSSQQYAVSSST